VPLTIMNSFTGAEVPRRNGVSGGAIFWRAELQLGRSGKPYLACISHKVQPRSGAADRSPARSAGFFGSVAMQPGGAAQQIAYRRSAAPPGLAPNLSMHPRTFVLGYDLPRLRRSHL